MRRLALFLLTLTSTLVLRGQENAALKELLDKSTNSSDSATYYLDSARKLLRSQADTANFLYYTFYHYQGTKLNDSAYHYADKVIPYLREQDSLNRLREVYERLHFIELRSGQYEQAIEYINKALSVAEQMKDTAMISLHLSDKSIIYHDFEDYERGIDYGKQAYDIMSRASQKQYRYLIFANNAIGINFDDWGKADSALYYHYKNVELVKKTEDSLRYAFIFNNIGNTNLKKGNYQEAGRFIKRALKMNLILDRDYNLASNYTNLATIAYRLGNYQEAEEYFELARKYADASGSIEKIRDVVQQEAWFYKKKGDFERALERQEAYYVLRDSVFQIERAGRFAEMETKYQAEKKERALAETRATLAERELEVKRKNYLIFGSLGLVLLLGLLGYLVYSRQRLKNRQLQKENELKTALARIETQNKLQEQRLRISRDLHDNIGSQLTFIISSIDSLKFGIGARDEKLRERLGRISTFTRDTIYELRDTIWAMNKKKISVEDLRSRISNFIDKAKTASAGISFSFEVGNGFTSDFHFSSVTGMNIYRIIQEGVNNSIKHSEADRISVKIDRVNQDVIVEVVDNGKGFDRPEELDSHGLMNMEKRARELGGKLLLESTKGQGTAVRFELSE